jgi:hypothetical protein
MLPLLLFMAVVIFLAGAGAGFLAVVVLGIQREERRLAYQMQPDPPSRVLRGARAATGLHVIARPGYEAMSYRHRQPPSAPDW